MIRRNMALVVALGSFGLAFFVGGAVQTLALLVDRDANAGNVLASATRLVEIPAECAHLAPFDNVIVGDDGPNVRTGENGRKDLIFGYGGNDTLRGDSQDDCLVGGSGDDTLQGEEGQDVLIGGSGNDVLDGNEGKDLLFGGSEDDVLFGDNAQDELQGEDGTDTCSGERAPDRSDCEVELP